MIVRQALFEGIIHPGREQAFRDYVEEKLLPLWQAFPGVREVRVLHAVDRDEGAPVFAMILPPSMMIALLWRKYWSRRCATRAAN